MLIGEATAGLHGLHDWRATCMAGRQGESPPISTSTFPSSASRDPFPFLLGFSCRLAFRLIFLGWRLQPLFPVHGGELLFTELNGSLSDME